jgi:uncharacterized protein YkwD/LysM repeat protein
MRKPFYYLFFLTLLFLTFSLSIPPTASANPLMQTQITTPGQMIAAVNNLRLSYGLPPLADHPILMQTAQSQADYMAATGNVTHARPGGITYTQQLLSLGFPLAGDLSLGGFRAENIITSNGPLIWDGVPSGWQDPAHMNTMLSQNFTHIGAGISQSGSRYYYAVDTAAATGSGQMQSNAPAILTSVPGGSENVPDASQYMVPVTVAEAEPDGRVFHTVQYGQSLWSIAIAYGTTIRNIQALNNLGEDLVIYQGQRLLVVTGATQSAPQVTETVIESTETPLPTTTLSAPPTMEQMIPSPIVDEEPSETSNASTGSSRGLVVVLIIAAFLGAGMAVWLIRDPSSS